MVLYPDLFGDDIGGRRTPQDGCAHRHSDTRGRFDTADFH
jgi:hypothetical protein